VDASQLKTEHCMKKLFIVCSLSFLMLGNAMRTFCYGNEDRNYTWSKTEAEKNVEDLLKEKFAHFGFFWGEYYDNTQGEDDARFIYRKVIEEIITNPANFKRIPVTTYVKKWSKDRTKSDAELKVENALRTLIYKRIEEIAPEFMSEKVRIANNIIDRYCDGYEKEFIGNRLTQKITSEMEHIRNEQHQIEYDAQSQINRYFTTQDCPVCFEDFGDVGKRVYLAPCGHNVCPDCYNNWQESCAMENKPFTCPLCRANIRGNEQEYVQPSYNPEYNR